MQSYECLKRDSAFVTAGHSSPHFWECSATRWVHLSALSVLTDCRCTCTYRWRKTVNWSTMCRKLKLQFHKTVLRKNQTLQDWTIDHNRVVACGKKLPWTTELGAVNILDILTVWLSNHYGSREHVNCSLGKSDPQLSGDLIQYMGHWSGPSSNHGLMAVD